MKPQTNRMNLALAIGAITSLMYTTAAQASEEEILPWQEVRIVCAERPETGKVELIAVSDTNGYRQVEIVAFGKNHPVPPSDLPKLTGYRLNSLRLTHEPGYKELGGHTVHLRLNRSSVVPDGIAEETVILSVSVGKGMQMGDPQKKVTLHAPIMLANNAWREVLLAMQAGDKDALAKACTEKGYQSIVKGIRAQEATADQLKGWAQAWSKWPLRIQSQTTTSLEVRFGSNIKEHGVSFLKTDDGWKLDQWLPGE